MYEKKKEITSVEEHKLVKEGIVTKEEIEPYISNYELLNTFAECIHLIDEKDTPLVKNLFEVARNFYPNNSLQGLKELMELSYQKGSDLFEDNILELLYNKQISFADIDYIEYSELNKIIEITLSNKIIKIRLSNKMLKIYLYTKYLYFALKQNLKTLCLKLYKVSINNNMTIYNYLYLVK